MIWKDGGCHLFQAELRHPHEDTSGNLSYDILTQPRYEPYTSQQEPSNLMLHHPRWSLVSLGVVGLSFLESAYFGNGVKKGKDKAVPLQAWSGPEGSRKLKFPDFMTTAQDGGKDVSLMHQLPLPPGNTPGTHFCSRLSRPQGHSATGRIMSLKNSNDTTRNRTRDLPVCSVVP